MALGGQLASEGPGRVSWGLVSGLAYTCSSLLSGFLGPTGPSGIAWEKVRPPWLDRPQPCAQPGPSPGWARCPALPSESSRITHVLRPGGWQGLWGHLVRPPHS